MSPVPEHELLHHNIGYHGRQLGNNLKQSLDSGWGIGSEAILE
jgi:hypothetical protein